MEEPDTEDKPPKTQPEVARGGAGRGRKTAIGAGNYDGNWSGRKELPGSSKIKTLVWLEKDLLREGVCAMIEPVAKIVATCLDAKSAEAEIERFNPVVVIRCVHPQGRHHNCRTHERHFSPLRFRQSRHRSALALMAISPL